MVSKKELMNSFTKSLVVEEERKNRVTTSSITSTLITAALNMAFVNESCKSTGQVSKSQVIYRKLEGKSKAEMQQYFRTHTTNVLKLLKVFSWNRHFIISFDETKEAFYGKRNKDPYYLHDGSIEKGSDCYYEFLSAAITCAGGRYVLDSVIFPVGGYKEDYIEEIVKFVKKVLPLKVVLFDRGFTSWELIHVLQKLKVSYIIFWKKQGDWYKEHFNKLEKGEFKRVFRTEKYYRDKIGYKVSSHFVLVKKLEYEGKKYDWIFATNLKLEKAENYVKVYKKRWGIETLFRVTDKIRIYTTSTNHLKRYFLFLFTCLVYNIWKWAQIFIGEDFTLANFKTNMAIFLTKHGLLYPKHYDKFEETMLNNNTPV